MIPENKIICGAMPEATKVFPDGYFNSCIASPPFWGLRDYGIKPLIWDGDKNCKHNFEIEIKKNPMDRGGNLGSFAEKRPKDWVQMQGKETKSGFCSKCGAWRGCLGLEPTFELYIKHLCDIYDEVKRVLRDDGTCWVNLGDTYNTHQAGNKMPCGLQQKTPEERAAKQKFERFTGSLPEKCLCLIPQRFTIEMLNRGWILRNVIIWHKPNPMPSSAKDRFTVDFEYVYFFVKSKKYWFEPQYEPNKTESNVERPRMGQGKNTIYKQKRNDYKKHTLRSVHGGNSDMDYRNPLGRNKRTVWTIPTQPYPEAHFATFPEKLVEPMIKAGCPEFVCTKCGKAREKIYDIQYEKIGSGTVGGRGRFNPEDKSGFTGKPKMRKIPTEIGYTDCGCNADWRPGIVLDCFCRFWDYFTGSCKAAA